MKFFINLIYIYAVLILFGVVAVGFNDWFGAGDLKGYAVFSLLLALTLSFILKYLNDWLIQRSLFIQLLLSLFLGLFTGIAFVILFLLMFGMWAGAMSVPILPTWTLGSLFSVLSLRMFQYPGKKWDLKLLILPFLFLSLLGLYYFKPLMSRINGEQKITFCTFKLNTSDEALKFDAADNWKRYFTAEKLALLRQSGLRGSLIPTGCSISGSDSRVNQVFIAVIRGHQDLDWQKFEIPKHGNLVVYSTGATYQFYSDIQEKTGHFLQILDPSLENNMRYKIETVSGTIGAY
jgi:hypothetical protein